MNANEQKEYNEVLLNMIRNDSKYVNGVDSIKAVTKVIKDKGYSLSQAFEYCLPMRKQVFFEKFGVQPE